MIAYMFSIAAVAILLVMAMTLFRAAIGPNTYDRILAVNVFGTLAVMLIAVLGFLNGRPEFLDLALVYALINFIGTIAVAKYIRFNDMGIGTGRDEGGDI